MTPAQLATLKTDIQAQPSLASAVTAADWPTIAAFYNAAASPSVNVWRSDVKASEVVAAITYSEYVALTAVKQGGLALLIQPGTVDATSSNVRAAFQAIFGASTSLTALTNLAQRAATALEKLFGSGGPPITSTLYGHVLTADEVQQAMR